MKVRYINFRNECMDVTDVMHNEMAQKIRTKQLINMHEENLPAQQRLKKFKDRKVTSCINIVLSSYNHTNGKLMIGSHRDIDVKREIFIRRQLVLFTNRS